MGVPSKAQTDKVYNMSKADSVNPSIHIIVKHEETVENLVPTCREPTVVHITIEQPCRLSTIHLTLGCESNHFGIAGNERVGLRIESVAQNEVNRMPKPPKQVCRKRCQYDHVVADWHTEGCSTTVATTPPRHGSFRGSSRDQRCAGKSYSPPTTTSSLRFHPYHVPGAFPRHGTAQLGSTVDGSCSCNIKN